mmetsp:Transcript_4753/g.12473  ORF Transcript_4753/g.12473 Transcript_4753/m.12473 type:complete len:104 (+) Transcript_4753:761-1072(+)
MFHYLSRLLTFAYRHPQRYGPIRSRTSLAVCGNRVSNATGELIVLGTRVTQGDTFELGMRRRLHEFSSSPHAVRPLQSLRKKEDMQLSVPCVVVVVTSLQVYG